MIEKLYEYLNEFQNISDKDKELIHNNVRIARFAQDDTFIEAGKITNQVGFLTSGIFRFYFYNKEGDEITSYFMKEGEFVTSLTSFFEHSPSTGTIEAVTACEMLIISRESWELFLDKIPKWNTIIQEITQQTLLVKSNFQRNLISRDAKTSYLNFIEEYPTIVQRVPLIYIASFLGITKFSLSRIRKQITDI